MDKALFGVILRTSKGLISSLMPKLEHLKMMRHIFWYVVYFVYVEYESRLEFRRLRIIDV